MSDAFRCDECGDYFDGEPFEVVYSKEVYQKQAEYVVRAELCESCSEVFAGGNE